MPKFIDLTGQRFGRLVALRRDERRPGVKVQWVCQCDCGNLCSPQAGVLRGGRAKSCGCLAREETRARKRTHGLSKEAGFMVWHQMHQRCGNPSHVHYASYGGRGISVCERWSSLATFLSDMGPRHKGHQLERLDNDKGYSPDNCVWATREQQARNRRNSLHVTLDGEVVSPVEAAERTGIPYPTIYYRYIRGLTQETGLFARRLAV